MACTICCPNKININIISIPTKFRSPGGENTHVNSRQNWCCSIIAYGEKTSLTANVGTNAHNIYEIAITTAILIGRFRIANLPNFFSNFTKKLKLNFPHFHFAYQFDIIPYIHKKSNRHARILRLWQSLFSYTSIPFSPICFYDCFSFSGGIRMIVPSGTRRS